MLRRALIGGRDDLSLAPERGWATRRPRSGWACSLIRPVARSSIATRPVPIVMRSTRCRDGVPHRPAGADRAVSVPSAAITTASMSWAATRAHRSSLRLSALHQRGRDVVAIAHALLDRVARAHAVAPIVEQRARQERIGVLLLGPMSPAVGIEPGLHGREKLWIEDGCVLGRESSGRDG